MTHSRRDGAIEWRAYVHRVNPPGVTDGPTEIPVLALWIRAVELVYSEPKLTLEAVSFSAFLLMLR